MCQSISSNSSVEKAPNTSRTPHLHPDQIDVLSSANASRLNYPSWSDNVQVLIQASAVQFHLAQLTSRAQGTPSLQPAPAWCSAAMGTARELRENSKTLIQQLPQQTTPEQTAPSFLSRGNTATEMLKSCATLQRGERAGADQTQQLRLTACVSPAQTPARVGTSQYLCFYFNLTKMLWTQMNSLCKSNIVFLIFKCELQVPH